MASGLNMVEEQEIHLRDYLRVVAKRRFTVFTVFLVVVVVTVIATFTATPIYRASTKILIERNSPDPLAGRYYYQGYDPEFLDTQNQLIKSFKVGQKVVQSLELDKNYASYFPEVANGGGLLTASVRWTKDLFRTILVVTGMGPASAENAGAAPAEAIGEGRSEADLYAKMISSGIEVVPVGESRVVTISYASPHPVLAQRIVNSVAQAYIDELLEIRLRTSGYAIQWMTTQAEKERLKLARSEEALQDYSRSKDIVTVEDRIAILPQKLAEVGSELTKAEARRKELETLVLRIDEVVARGGDPETIPAIAANAPLQTLRGQVTTAEKDLIELSRKYGEKHPVMIRAVGELAVLKKNLAGEEARVIQSFKNELELAASQEQNFREQLARTKSEAIDLNEKFIQYGILKREIDSNRLLYEALIKKINEQSATEQTQTVTVWIVEEAAVPEVPAKPNKQKNLLLGVMLGLFGGIGLAFFVEYLDNTVKSPDDVEKRLGVPVLGVVELFKGDKKGIKIQEAVVTDAMSVFAESYKAIRSAVLLSAVDKPPRTVLVTSCSSQEGKTTTAANLAMTIGQIDKKVLLIDADLRRPAVNKFFDIDNFKGLSTYLCGISGEDIIVELPDRHISVIPSGPIPPNPSELLSSARLNRLLESLGDRYDMIIIDSPPLLDVSDSLILSKIVEGTIVVVRGGETIYERLARGVKSLHDINAHVLGMIINAVDLRKSYYYHYGSYYSSYYTYGSTEVDAKADAQVVTKGGKT